MTTLVAIVCGSRHGAPDGTWRQFVPDALHAFDRDIARIVCVVQGGCRGRNGETSADQWAAKWAMDRERPFFTWPAAWETGDRTVRSKLAAGPHRNAEMARITPALAEHFGCGWACLALPGGSGTDGMADLTVRCGAPVWRYEQVDGAWRWVEWQP